MTIENVPASTPTDDFAVPAPGRTARWERWTLGFALVFPTFVTWLYFIALAESPAAIQQTAYSLGKLVQFVLPVVWVLVVLHRRPKLSASPTRGLFAGLLFGALIAGAMLGLYHMWLKPIGFFDAPGEGVRAKLSGIGVSSVLVYAVIGVFYSLAHSLLEEYYWRWFVFRRLTCHTSLAMAIGVSSLGFMAHHVLVLATYFGFWSFATWFFSLSIAVGGAVWAWLYYRSRSLLGPWLSHLLVDAAIFLIGYDLSREIFK
ncbi:MAG: CPBP family intramembrane metalloprotease [Planctomycetales bacterium]|nr:CPBP family intramembrane metalloprotease [Planctomycetales bacterium]